MRKSFTIERSKWVRGRDGGSSCLLNGGGRKCCLGFYESQVNGRTDNEIRHVLFPSGLAHPSVLTDTSPVYSIHQTILADCNDAGDISEENREAFIADYFATWLDTDVRFVP